MTITREEARHIARLARLALSDEETDLLQGQLAALLDYVKQLDRLDASGVIPTIHVVETGAPLRDDIARPFGDTEALLKNAPDRSGDFLRVPRIME